MSCQNKRNRSVKTLAVSLAVVGTMMDASQGMEPEARQSGMSLLPQNLIQSFLPLIPGNNILTLLKAHKCFHGPISLVQENPFQLSKVLGADNFLKLYNHYFPMVQELDLRAHFTSGQSADLALFTNLTLLGLSTQQTTDDVIRHLSSLTKLQFLSMGTSKITDTGLAELTFLTNLKVLNLNYCSDIMDAGIAKLSPNLLKLRIPSCGGVTGDGLKTLVNLEVLDMSACSYEMKNLPLILKDLTKLQSLSLTAGQSWYCEEQEEIVKEVLPNCIVDFGN